MGFDFRIGGDQQAYAAPTTQTAAAEGVENETTRLTMGKSKDGDTVSISKQGKDKLAAMQAGSEEDSEQTSSIDQQIEKIKEQIDKIKEEIAELQKNPEKNKDQIVSKQSQLMQYQGQLTELQNQKNKANGASAKGGTRAEGMGKSLT